MLQKRCCSSINELPATYSVRVAGFKAPCMFYRKVGEQFYIDELVPEGICPDLFYHIYPLYLSLLYGVDNRSNKQSYLVSCPGQQGKTHWRIYAKRMLVGPIISVAESFFRIIGRPKDLINKIVVMEFHATDGYCPREYSENNIFTINQYSHLWKRRFFCPAVFYTLFPLLIGISSKGCDIGKSAIRCPADNASIVFELKH